MSERSRERCPVCGEAQLAVIEFPHQGALGYVPYNEILGMGNPTVVSPPAIGCLACGAEWPDLAAFEAARDAGAPLEQ